MGATEGAEGDPIAMALSQKYHNIAMTNQNLGGADLAAVLSYLEARGTARDLARNEPAPGDQAPVH